MKSQMKSADRSGALVALLVGPKELAEGTVVLRPLRQDDEQRSVARADIVAEVRRAAAESIASS
jgi:histidyl-tRNA synthetase